MQNPELLTNSEGQFPRQVSGDYAESDPLDKLRATY